MTRRTSRQTELSESFKSELLEALGNTRRLINRAQGTLAISSPTYVAGTETTAAIDRLAGQLTGDLEHFWIKSPASSAKPP